MVRACEDRMANKHTRPKIAVAREGKLENILERRSETVTETTGKNEKK